MDCVAKFKLQKQVKLFILCFLYVAQDDKYGLRSNVGAILLLSIASLYSYPINIDGRRFSFKWKAGGYICNELYSHCILYFAQKGSK